MVKPNTTKIDTNSGSKPHLNSTCKILLSQGNHNCWRQCLLLPTQGLLRLQAHEAKKQNHFWLELKAEHIFSSSAGKREGSFHAPGASCSQQSAHRHIWLQEGATRPQPHVRMAQAGSREAAQPDTCTAHAASSAPPQPPGRYTCMEVGRGHKNNPQILNNTSTTTKTKSQPKTREGSRALQSLTTSVIGFT